jgi:hypothetical protein
LSLRWQSFGAFFSITMLAVSSTHDQWQMSALREAGVLNVLPVST